MTSLRTVQEFAEVTSTEPSGPTSTELESVPVLKVLISVREATPTTDRGAKAEPSQTTRNLPSAVMDRSSPGFEMAMGADASTGGEAVRSTTQTRKLKSVKKPRVPS